MFPRSVPRRLQDLTLIAMIGLAYLIGRKGIADSGPKLMTEAADTVSSTVAAAGDLELAPFRRGMMPMPMPISSRQRGVDMIARHAFAGPGRLTLNRQDDAGNPVRVLRTPWHLYIRHLRAERRPVDHPQRDDGTARAWRPRFLDLSWDSDDWGATNRPIARRQPVPYEAQFQPVLGKRPTEELYELWKDPDCLVNVAASPDRVQVRAKLANKLDNYRRQTRDPWLYGPTPVVADTYLYYDRNWSMNSERHRLNSTRFRITDCIPVFKGFVFVPLGRTEWSSGWVAVTRGR